MRTEQSIKRFLEELKKLQSKNKYKDHLYRYLEGQIETLEWVLQ